ncbi:ABC transporter substrate-binding protein, partial [Pseudactinotalea suaedae]
MSPMHRRQFLTFAAGTTGAVALAGVLSACGGGSAGQDSTSGSTDDAGTTALISIGNSEGDPANLDTGMQNTFANLSTVGSACHAYLLYLGADGSLEGDLATGFESESDTRIRFDLREGVTFHNGRAMTAQDVVDSFERLMNPDGGSPYAALLSPIETIEVVDDKSDR